MTRLNSIERKMDEESSDLTEDYHASKEISIRDSSDLL